MRFCFLLYLILPFCFADDKNGGVICAACGVVGAWIEEYGLIYRQDSLCGRLVV